MTRGKTQTLVLGSLGALLVGAWSAQAHATCGTSGTVDDRIADCQRQVRTKATKSTYREVYDEESKDFEHREFSWSLVTQIAEKKQVWRDNTTGLIWSDATDEPIDYSYEGFHVCPRYQHEMEMVAGKGISRHLKINDTHKYYALETEYRLPSVEDYDVAERHGIRTVLPDWRNNQQYWTSTPSDTRPNLTREHNLASAHYKDGWYYKIVGWAREGNAEGELVNRPVHVMQAFMQSCGAFMDIAPGLPSYVRCVTK